MTTNAANAGHVRRLTAHIDSFLDGFRATGYAPAAVTSRRLIINAFIRSIASKRRAAEDLSEADVIAFFETATHAPRGSQRNGPYCAGSWRTSVPRAWVPD